MTNGREFGVEPNERQIQKIIKEKHDFVIPEGCFWEDVRNASIDKKNESLNKAVTQISEENSSLKGIINTVRWNEPSPDGSGGKKLNPEVISLLVSYLDAVDLSNRNTSVDVLGDAYEYLIKRFADENKGGTMAGQFYTPQEIVDIIVRYLKPQKGETAYDPTCGSFGFMINTAKYIKRETSSQKNIRLYGQEDVWNTWAIANINMILHGLDAQIKKGDTLKEPLFTDEDNELAIKKFDLVMANFPFSVENWWKNGVPKRDNKGKAITKKDGSPQLEYTGKEEFKDPYERFTYGIPPFSNGDFAFIQHIVASLNEKGRGGVICPQDVLFRGQPERFEEEDGQKRKADDEYLIRRGFLQGVANSKGKFTQNVNIIDAIVVLPGKLFYSTPIPGAIIFFNKNKPEERKDKVLMVYAAKEGWYKEEPNRNVLLPQDILRISTILESWGDIEKAKYWISSQKTRLREIIQEELDFKLSEIDIETREDIEALQKKVKKSQEDNTSRESEGKKIAKNQLNVRENAKKSLEKLLAEKQHRIDEAHELAEKERIAIEDVEKELIEMYNDSELRKRYFTVVDLEEIEENEFNLSIPRYVDTFEPEQEVDLQEAIEEFEKINSKENCIDYQLGEFLGLLK